MIQLYKIELCWKKVKKSNKGNNERYKRKAYRSRKITV